MSNIRGVEVSTCQIKICGFKYVEQMEPILELAVDQIGLIFAKSKRQVSVEQAERMVRVLTNSSHKAASQPAVVGVFVNCPIDELRSIVDRVKLDVVQLHGDETTEYCKQLKQSHPTLSIWKVIAVSDEVLAVLDNEVVTQLIYDQLIGYSDVVDTFLLDTPGGGTGKTFRWDTIPAYRNACSRLQRPLYVAGGLHPDNVSTLLEQYDVAGVDVSSGVETDGEKDWDKIRLFVRKVREI